MQTTLDSAHAWFFDSLSHVLSGALLIRLTEGIKGSERQFVDVGETRIGPFFPVQVHAQSRCVQIEFKDALAFFVYNECYDTGDPELAKGIGRFLFRADSSAFRKFAESRTSIAHLHQGPYQEFLLCCEDRVVHVLAAEPPEVTALNDEPDLTVRRTRTWSAS